MTIPDDPLLDHWGPEEEPGGELEAPRWRRWLIVLVATVTVVAMGLVPLYNVIRGGQSPIADNGLEVCGYDYCIVLDGVRAAGLEALMSRMANTYLSDLEAEALATSLVARLGEAAVNMQIVDHLDGNTEGQYAPSTRTILLERPIRAWVVLHEVAHVEAVGHDDEFQDVVNELATWLESQSS